MTQLARTDVPFPLSGRNSENMAPYDLRTESSDRLHDDIDVRCAGGPSFFERLLCGVCLVDGEVRVWMGLVMGAAIE